MRTWCRALSCSSVNSAGCSSGNDSSPSCRQLLTRGARMFQLTERAVSTRAVQSSFGKNRLRKSRLGSDSRMTSSISEKTSGKLSLLQFSCVSWETGPTAEQTITH
jgi:hypothetical protein